MCLLLQRPTGQVCCESVRVCETEREQECECVHTCLSQSVMQCGSPPQPWSKMLEPGQAGQTAGPATSSAAPKPPCFLLPDSRCQWLWVISLSLAGPGS